MDRTLSRSWTQYGRKRCQLGIILPLVSLTSIIACERYSRILLTSYNMLKKRALDGGDPNSPLSTSEYLLFSAEASPNPSMILPHYELSAKGRVV